MGRAAWLIHADLHVLELGAYFNPKYEQNETSKILAYGEFSLILNSVPHLQQIGMSPVLLMALVSSNL